MITENVELKPYNTFGIQVNASTFGTFSSIEELRDCLKSNGDQPLLILGGGSNILFTQPFNGLVLKNEILGFSVEEESDYTVLVTVGGGEVWHNFVMKCIDLNFGGVENLSLIPGSVGASPMQNIGAYGVEIKDVFHSLEAYEIKTGDLKTFSHEDCQFGYRESIFKRSLKGQFIITRVTFRLTSKNHTVKTSYGDIENELERNNIQNPTIKDISNAVIAIRSSKLPDPKEIGNAGSFFKNPIVDASTLDSIKENYENVPNYPAGPGKVKLAAGWLIDQAGWKGKTFGNFGVHKKQALVLVNYDDCTGKDIYTLSEQIIADINDKFGVTLEREVNIV